MTTTPTLDRRALLASMPVAGLALYGAGLLGAGTAQASTKQIAGIGIRIKKHLGGSNARVRTVASDPAGRFSVTVADAGDQGVDIDKAALQMAVNAEVGAYGAGATERIVIIRFAPGLRVSAPPEQNAVPSKPGTFILSSGTQTFVVANMAAGSVISGVIETLDVGDLFPGMTARGIKDKGVAGCNGCGMTGRIMADPGTGSGATSNVLKTKHDTAKNSIPNVR